jgi:hypothetical protein
MKNLQVIKIEANEKITLKNVSLLLDNLAEINKLECINWKDYPHKPRVEFRIGHDDNLILLKFTVTENSIRAMETEINGRVFQDSCVEFFISLDGQHYYNFEFNCIGTPHAAWGNNRHDRQHLPLETVKEIQIRSSLGPKPFDVQTGVFSWELVAVIPASCFIFDPGLNFAGLSGNANFYKCGDELPEPHFITWNPVATLRPDFHRPEFFGKIDFE